MQNINDFIAILNTLSEKNSFEVYIPSLGKNILFKPLTTGQQRLFYLCVSDNMLFNTKFVLTTFQIIEENCLEKVYIKKFTVLDRISILLALRKNALGSEMLVEKENVQYTVNFESSFEYIKTAVLPENKTIEAKGIKLLLHTPLLIDQYGIEKELRENTNKQTTVDELLKESILNEACKYVDEIILEDVEVDYKSLSYKDRITLIEKLPVEFMYEIQNYAESVVDIQNQILEVKIDQNNSIGFDLTVDFFLDR